MSAACGTKAGRGRGGRGRGTTRGASRSSETGRFTRRQSDLPVHLAATPTNPTSEAAWSEYGGSASSDDGRWPTCKPNLGSEEESSSEDEGPRMWFRRGELMFHLPTKDPSSGDSDDGTTSEGEDVAVYPELLSCIRLPLPPKKRLVGSAKPPSQPSSQSQPPLAPQPASPSQSPSISGQREKFPAQILAHFPKKMAGLRRRCRICKNRTRLWCPSCEAPLCVSKDCYTIYHRRMYESSKGSSEVKGLEGLLVRSKDEVYQILAQGQERRRIASTLMNAQSRPKFAASPLATQKENILTTEASDP